MLIAQRPAGPAWTSVMGCEVLFAPIDRAMMRRARRSALSALGRGDDGGDGGEAGEQLEELGDALSHALIVAGAQDWRAVALQRVDDEGRAILVDGEPVFDPLDFSDENLAMVLADPVFFDAFDAAYVLPFVARSREKNGSAASPSGTGGAATPASDTASYPAKLKSASDAEHAPTANTRLRATPRKRSGRS